MPIDGLCIDRLYTDFRFVLINNVVERVSVYLEIILSSPCSWRELHKDQATRGDGRMRINEML